MQIADNAPVDGHCDRRFAGLADAFAENFRTRGEVGAAVAVVLNGEPVVDLWGGFADSARTRPWAEDMLVCMMSVAKAVTALCAAMAVDRGLIGWDEPWRATGAEFRCCGQRRLSRSRVASLATRGLARDRGRPCPRAQPMTGRR